MKIFFCLLVFFVAIASPIHAEDDSGFYAVILNGEGRNFPPFSLFEEYSINEFRYSSQKGSALIENICKAKLLYVGQYSESFLTITNNKILCEAVKNLLKKGGCIFFDFSSTSKSYDTFLNEVGVNNPAGSFSDGYYNSVILPENTGMKIFNIPNKISGTFKCYGWWETWTDKQIAALRDFAKPENRAAMIIQENVLGKGRIIFNQYPEIFRNPIPLTENILSYIYGIDLKEYKKSKILENGGPGELIAY